MDDYLISNQLLPWVLEGLLEELLAEEEMVLPADRSNADLFKSSRMEGYLTQNWFGPFLLGPQRQTTRGNC